jgi:hypothetical protein
MNELHDELDEQPAPPEERVEPMPTPQLRDSTRIGLWILAGLVVYSLIMPWLPYPFGIALTLLWLYVGLPLFLLLWKDLGQLRRDRMLARHALLRVSVEDEEVLGLQIEEAPLAQEHLQSWHAWRRWLVLGGVLALLLGLFGNYLEDWRLGLAFAVLAWIPFWLRDMYFALSALGWIPPETWRTLSLYDRVALRVHAGVMSVCALALVAGVVWLMVKVFRNLKHDEFWRLLLFTLVWGGILLGIASFGLRRAWDALRPVPRDYEAKENPDAKAP